MLQTKIESKVWAFAKPTRFFFHYWRVDNKVKLVFGPEEGDHIIAKNVKWKVPTRTEYQIDKSPSLIVVGKCRRIEFDAETDSAIVT